MNRQDALRQILSSGVVSREPPEVASTVHAAVARLGADLPELHEELLVACNGVTAYGGYFRLFSTERLSQWNDPELWKFAWPATLCEYVCFGETGWGDQYAYRVEDLKRGQSAVYFLDALTLQPEKICDDYGRFLLDEFLRTAVERTTRCWSLLGSALEH